MAIWHVLGASLALACSLATANAADLTVWWETGFTPEENQAVKELAVAFEGATGNHVRIASYSQDDMPVKVLAALKIDRPPDFLFGSNVIDHYDQWAYEGRLVDIADTLGPLAGEGFPRCPR